MTRIVTEERLQANRRNARRSTGPRSPDGLARSAQNARRHGLAAEIGDGEEVFGVERMLFREPGTRARLAVEGEILRQRALARAEVAVARARARLAEIDDALGRLAAEGGFAGTPEERGRAALLERVGLGPEAPEETRRVAAACLRITGRPSLLDPVTETLRQRRLAVRYLTEAESARRRALGDWCAPIEPR